ncbi:MAG: hypothetical protein GF355_03505, partial [Candidatus Eisenbacteria bacterium]|nr:hypothetical protein [Candidatus Eisenbacteria bacterium]
MVTGPLIPTTMSLHPRRPQSRCYNPRMSVRRNLGLLWAGQFISNLGDQIFAVLVTFL